MPLKAATSKSDALAANIRLDVQFLVRANEAAALNSGSDSIKRFAMAQKIEQLKVLDALSSGAVDETAELAPGTVTTGRSVARTTEVGGSALPLTAASLPAATVGLDHVTSAKGEAFDALYVSMERSVLASLAEACDAYSKIGDNPANRRVAQQELLLARGTLAALPEVQPSAQPN